MRKSAITDEAKEFNDYIVVVTSIAGVYSEQPLCFSINIFYLQVTGMTFMTDTCKIIYDFIFVTRPPFFKGLSDDMIHSLPHKN